MKRIILASVLFVGSLVLLPALSIPILAQTDNTDADDFSLVDLLPDIEKIYREALVLPHQEAAKVIYDQEIAEYYNLLLHKTGLDIPVN